MITVALLDDLLTRMQIAGLTTLEVEHGDTRIVMRLGAAPTLTTRTPVPVKTQGIGIFHAAHPRRPGSALKPGERVLEGAVLGYLEADATLTAILAPATGTLAEILATEGDLLGFGAHVFTLEESAP